MLEIQIILWAPGHQAWRHGAGLGARDLKEELVLGWGGFVLGRSECPQTHCSTPAQLLPELLHNAAVLCRSCWKDSITPAPPLAVATWYRAQVGCRQSSGKGSVISGALVSLY